MSFEQKRNAERLPLDEPMEGMVGGVAVKIVDLSAIGCRIQHKEKLASSASILLRFIWQDERVEVRAKLVRTELRPGMVYESGLKFADSLEESPLEIRTLLASLLMQELPPEIEQVAPSSQAIAAPAEIEEPPYVECLLENGQWKRQRVHSVKQPAEGFITVPQPERELDMLCKSYEYADPFTRKLIRLSLELAATNPKSD